MKQFKENMVNSINNYNSKRSKNITKQVIISFLFKIIAVTTNLIQVPILFNILKSEEYGLWLTIISIVTWLGIMDIGIGNGLRNKLSEALAKNDIINGQRYISTAYTIVGTLMIISTILSIIIIPHLNWASILNTDKIISKNEIVSVITIITTTTFLIFILSLINQVLNALQKNSLIAIPNIASGICFTLIIYILSKNNLITLNIAAITYSITYIISYSIFSIFIFKKHIYLIPKYKYFKKGYIKDLLSLGIKYFIIQIAVVVIFSTDNFLIANIFSTNEVSVYNITFRVFNSVSLVISLIIAPLWSAYTEAYTKGDYLWIKKRLRLLEYSIIPFALFLIIVNINFNKIIKLWIGQEVVIPTMLPTFMAIFVLVAAWNNIYASFLNGISQTKEQLVTSIIAMVLNIPLAIFFSKNMGLGIKGVIMSTIVCLSLFAVIGPITTYKILKKNEY